MSSALHGGHVVLTGTVREGTGARRSANQVVIDADRIVLGDAEVSARGGVLATLRTPVAVLPGDQVQLDAGGLRPPRSTGSEAALPRENVEAVAQSASLSVVAKGGVSASRLLAVARARLAAVVDAALSEPAASLVNGLTFAIPQRLPLELTAALRDSGLAHMLAVSGLKVVLVSSLVGALLSALATPPRLRLVLMAGAVGGYVLLCGASPAAVRSASMAATGWALYGTGRWPDPLPLLTAVAAAMLLVAPELSRDVGFQLSFLGTLGILLLATPMAQRLPGPRLLREPFAVTLAASLVTVPVMASTFGVVSLVGPLANALAVPLLAPLIVSGGLGAALATLASGLGFIPLQISGGLATLIAAVAGWCASVPLAALHFTSWSPVLTAAEVGAVLAGGVTWGVLARRRSMRSIRGPWLPRAAGEARREGPAVTNGGFTAATAAPSFRLPRPAAVAIAGVAALLAGSAVLVVASRPDGRLHVAVLDVGAARAVAIQTASGDHALVDTGSDPQRLLQALGPALPPLSGGVGMVVLTGGDRLAVGGLTGLADRYHVDRAVAPADALPSATRTALAALADRGTAVAAAGAGSVWSWGGATWRLLAPPGSMQSTALQVEDASGSALLLGNLDAAAQEELAGLHDGRLHADLLVTPPSGAVAPALLAAVHPRNIAVPSAHGGRTASATLVAGPGVRRTGDAGTLTYVGGDGGLTAT
jgi:competence protein ComEC